MSTDNAGDREIEKIAERYAKRTPNDSRYSRTRLEVQRETNQRLSVLCRYLRLEGLSSEVERLRVVEVGCGSGSNLLELLLLGFQPENLTGIELLQDRADAARSRLPSKATVICDDARVVELPPGGANLILAYTVFSSILDSEVQEEVASKMWDWLCPGGAIALYDFTIRNPQNPDVLPVDKSRVRELFPEGLTSFRRLTLAPPIARATAEWPVRVDAVLARLPGLRSHILAWVKKS